MLVLPPQNDTPYYTYRAMGRISYNLFNPFMPTVPTFAVRETDVSWDYGGTAGAPLKPLRDDSALRALSSLRGLRGAPLFKNIQNNRHHKQYTYRIRTYRC